MGLILLTAGAQLGSFCDDRRSPKFQTTNVTCVANDLTNPGRGVNAVPQTGGTSVLFTGVTDSGGDTISYQCVGN